MDDTELARRSIRGFGEMVAALGKWGVDPSVEIRRPRAVGARVDVAGHNPWMNAVVVPFDEEPEADSPELPYCVWTVADAVPGRIEEPAIATPCLGVVLADLADGYATPALTVERPSLEELGAINERAYGQFGVFAPLISGLRDERVTAHGVRDQGVIVSVALTLVVDDDLSLQYVATEASHRRRGLASGLLLALMKQARANGLQSATLQASPDGLPVYERLGFRRVETLRGFVRPSES